MVIHHVVSFLPFFTFFDFWVRWLTYHDLGMDCRPLLHLDNSIPWTKSYHIMIMYMWRLVCFFLLAPIHAIYTGRSAVKPASWTMSDPLRQSWGSDFRNVSFFHGIELLRFFYHWLGTHIGGDTQNHHHDLERSGVLSQEMPEKLKKKKGKNGSLWTQSEVPTERKVGTSNLSSKAGKATWPQVFKRTAKHQISTCCTAFVGRLVGTWCSVLSIFITYLAQIVNHLFLRYWQFMG